MRDAQLVDKPTTVTTIPSGLKLRDAQATEAGALQSSLGKSSAPVTAIRHAAKREQRGRRVTAFLGIERSGRNQVNDLYFLFKKFITGRNKVFFPLIQLSECTFFVSNNPQPPYTISDTSQLAWTVPFSTPDASMASSIDSAVLDAAVRGDSKDSKDGLNVFHLRANSGYFSKFCE